MDIENTKKFFEFLYECQNWAKLFFNKIILVRTIQIMN